MDFALISPLRGQLQSPCQVPPTAVALRHAPAGAAPRGKPFCFSFPRRPKPACTACGVGQFIGGGERCLPDRGNAELGDALTGLENRLQYQRFLAGPIPAGPIGAVFCDINSLKQINDRYGHSRGDAVIMQTADVLRACFPGAHIYRMSGDEFVVLCPGVTQARFETMLAKARDRLASETDYGVSLGGAWHACAREDLDELVRAADESMYADKQEHYGVPEHG